MSDKEGKIGQWQEYFKIPENKLKFVGLTQELINLLDDDYDIGKRYGRYILEQIRDIVGQKEFRSFMTEVVPTYPLLISASKLAKGDFTQSELIRCSHFFRIAYFMEKDQWPIIDDSYSWKLDDLNKIST